MKNNALPGKILNLFWEPSASFGALKEKTSWFDIVLPIVLITIMSYAIMPTIGPIVQKETNHKIEKSEKLSDAQKEVMLERINKQMNSPIRYITAPIAIGIQVLLIALAMWFVGNFLLGGDNKFTPVFGMSAYVGLVDIVATVVRTPIMISKQTMTVYTGAALFLPESQSFLFRLATQIDIFSIWKVILLSIGLAVFNKTKTSKTLIPVVIVWLVYCLGAAALAGLQQF